METEEEIANHSTNTSEVGDDAEYGSAYKLVENTPPRESAANTESGGQQILEESSNGRLALGEGGRVNGNLGGGGGALDNTKEVKEKEDFLQTQTSAQSHDDIDPLSSLPDEIILTILTFVDVSDLFTLLKTSHRLRNISLDPLLHQQRLIRAKTYLAHVLPHRPPLEALRSPRRIWLSRRDYTSRELSRGLLKIRLNKKLGMRPDPGVLVERGVLKEGYLKRYGGGGGGHGGGGERQKSGEEKRTGKMVANKQELEQENNEKLISNDSFSYTTTINATTTSFDRQSNTRIALNQGSSTGFVSSSSKKLPQLQNNLSHIPHGHNNCTYYFRISPALLPTCLTLEKQLLRNRLAHFVRTLPSSPEFAHEKLVKSRVLPPPLPPPSLPSQPASSSSFFPSSTLFAPAHDSLTNSHHSSLLSPYSHTHSSSSPSSFSSLVAPHHATNTISKTSLKRPSVRYLIKRYSFRAQVDPGKFIERESRWGRGAEGRRRRKWERRERVGEEVEGAGRQKVRALRKFYEKLGSSSGCWCGVNSVKERGVGGQKDMVGSERDARGKEKWE